MANSAFTKALLLIAKSTFMIKKFRSYKCSGYTLSRKSSYGAESVILRYTDASNTYDLTAEEGADGGLRMELNEMAAQSFGYAALPHAEKVRIAQNIYSAITSQGLACEIIDEHRSITLTNS